MENYKNESMVDVAYSVLTEAEGELPFTSIYNEVCKRIGLASDVAVAKISSFYTNLLLDGRFVNLKDNTWDLKSRHTYKEVHPEDMSTYYSESEEEDREAMDVEEFDTDEERKEAGLDIDAEDDESEKEEY